MLTPFIVTLTQKSTNLKISVKIIKLLKQNWFAQYRNNQLRLQALKYTLYVVVCSWEFSCAHQDEDDIKRHILTNTHKDKPSSLRQQPTITVVPQTNPLT